MNNIIYQLLNFLSLCICYCYSPIGIVVRDSLDYGTNTHTQYDVELEEEKKSIDGHYNLLKELKCNRLNVYSVCTW